MDIDSHLFIHGGRLAAAAAAYPAAAHPWIDLSTGINPHAYPLPRIAAKTWHALPDPAELKTLEVAAAQAFGVEEPARVVATPGSEAALCLLPALVGGKKTVAIARHSYSSHAQAWAGHAITHVDDPTRADSDVVIVVNPNNPDGTTLLPNALQVMANQQAARDGWLIIDEAFGDSVPELSMAASSHEKLIVLRSFGKFFGLAGVRLGFVIAAPDVADRLRRLRGDWPVTPLALAAGITAYRDHYWTAAMRARLAEQSQRLDQLLSEAGYQIVGGTSLFRLMQTQQAHALFHHLAGQGILTRPFLIRKDWLRLGLPGTTAAWTRLRVALKAFRRSTND